LKKILLVLVIVLLLGCLGVSACSAQEETTNQGPTTTSTSSTTTASVTTPALVTTTAPAAAAGGLTWNDMPVYSGAGQIQKGSWSIPPAEGDYSKMEWRYYETNDSLDKVASFYKSQMPDKGWEEQGWVEVQEMNWSMYVKNNENDAAMIWVSSQDGKTVIALWRATKQ